jgi:CheY-like chemotaxis protein
MGTIGKSFRRNEDEQQEKFQNDKSYAPWNVRLFSRLISAGAAAKCPGISVSGTGPAILSKQKLVFVVDDDPGILKGVKRLLREYGYESLLFSSADAFQKHGDYEHAACVILDIDLNDDSGIEVCHRLKAAGITLPVIYITGKDNHATRMAAMASGCIAYLTKPFAARSLIEPIERACSGLA